MPSTDLPYKYHLNIIEGKLRSVGLSELDMNDVKFMKDITQCFYEIWKFRKMYPELDAKFDDDEMSPNFQANYAGELGAMCEFCEIEFPLLNNDLEYAYAMHEQTPEHLEMVDMSRQLQSLSTEDTTISSDRRNQLSAIKRSVTDSDSELRSKRLRVEVDGAESLSTSSSEGGYDDYTHTQTERNNLNGHVRRRTSRKIETIQKYGSRRKTSFSRMPISSLDEEFCGRIFSIADIYRSSERRRLSYFLNKVCIFSRLLTCNLDNERVYECGLCDVAFTADESFHVKVHLDDRKHRARVAKMIESIDPKSATLEPCIFKAAGLESNTKEHPLCRLCIVELPEIYPNVHFRHVQGGRHWRKVKAHFNLPLFEDWERGIILRNGSPYCLPCQVVLPTATSMWIHINERNHLNLTIH